MSIGTCRSEGCDQPRRVRRGLVEPLCEDCYRAACRRVAAELANEQAPETARRRFRHRTVITQQPATPQESSDGERRPAPARDRREPESMGRSRGRPPLISDALLEEAHRRHVDQQQPLRRIAGELLEHTAYANARGVELALGREF
jgi:hypothetical protein